MYGDLIIGFLHSIGFTYPELPTDGEKKKYYNLITSLPTFIPNNGVASNFQNLIDDYPVSSYLNSKESFLKWIHFIHNKINKQIEKRKYHILNLLIIITMHINQKILNIKKK